MAAEVAVFIVVRSIVSMEAHGATVGAGSGAGSLMLPSNTAVADDAVRPGPSGAPVSSTNGSPVPSARVKVNFGHTFSVESKVVSFIVIVPFDVL